MSSRLLRAWHWATDVVPVRTRRVTLLSWFLVLAFGQDIQRFVNAYGWIIQRVLILAILACSAGFVLQGAHAWWRGRPSRKAR